MKHLTNAFTETLGLKYPLIVAPMAGGPSSESLVVSASETGALGSIGAAYLSPQAIAEISAKIQQRTQKPFAINLFVPNGETSFSDKNLASALEETRPYREQLHLPVPALHPPYGEDFDKQFEEVMKLKPRVLSFIFGSLQREYMMAARTRGIFTIGTATSVSEALQLQESGVDAIVVQGVEAGGHRGIFNPLGHDPSIQMLDLLKSVCATVAVPVIAAGGIMNAREIELTLGFGAAAVQMGTAFLATTEAGTSEPYRKELLKNSIRSTRTTRAFSGRLARGIVNRFMNEMDAHPDAILPFPVQNTFTRDLRNAAARSGEAAFLSLWCGQGQGDLWQGATRDLIEALFPEA